MTSEGEARRKASEVLERSLTSLVEEADRVAARPEVVDMWNLEKADRELLVLCGLPLMEECRMVPHVQDEATAQLSGTKGAAYSLGLWAHYEVGALVESGEVRGVADEELSAEVFVNSSAGKYVEMMWRWYRLFKIVEPLRNGLEQYDVMEDFLAFAYDLDPAVETAERSLWRGFIQGW